MQIPPQIVLRHVPHPEALRPRVEALVRRLEHFARRVTACRVLVERPHLRHHDGNLYRVRIDLTLPQGELVVRRDPPARRTHEDVRVALRDAFDAARRRMEDFVRERRGDVKRHEHPLHGRVVRLLRDADFGFLRAADGREVYFHRHSVADDDWDRLSVGDTVSFAVEGGEEGEQAAWVRRSPEYAKRVL